MQERPEARNVQRKPAQQQRTQQQSRPKPQQPAAQQQPAKSGSCTISREQWLAMQQQRQQGNAG